MSTEYLRQDTPVESHESAIEPRNLYTVVNVSSHYFGQVVEQIDATHLNGSNGLEFWIKDSITGLWFKYDELETEDFEDDEYYPF